MIRRYRRRFGDGFAAFALACFGLSAAAFTLLGRRAWLDRRIDAACYLPAVIR